MKEIEDLFEALEPNADAFKNLAMLVMTILINKGLLSVHWDLTSQQFCFTVNYDYEDEDIEFEPEDDGLDFDPQEILRKMNLRNKKKD